MGPISYENPTPLPEEKTPTMMFSFSFLPCLPSHSLSRSIVSGDLELAVSPLPQSPRVGRARVLPHRAQSTISDIPHLAPPPTELHLPVLKSHPHGSQKQQREMLKKERKQKSGLERWLRG